MPGVGEWPTQDPGTVPVWRGMQYWNQQAPQYMANRPTTGGWQPQQWQPQANAIPPQMGAGRAVQFHRPQIDPALAGAWRQNRPQVISLGGGYERTRPMSPPAPPGVVVSDPYTQQADLDRARQVMLRQQLASADPMAFRLDLSPNDPPAGGLLGDRLDYQMAMNGAQQMQSAPDQQVQQMEIARRMQLLRELQRNAGVGAQNFATMNGA